MVDALNSNYYEHNFFFTLETIDRTENDSWFSNWEGPFPVTKPTIILSPIDSF